MSRLAAKIATAFRELKEKRSDIEEILYTILLYLCQTVKAEEQVQVQQEFERTLREGAEIMPTLAEYYIQQGREEGIQKGLQKGKKEGLQEGLQRAVLDILQTRFSNVPRRLVKKITAIDDMERLRDLHKKSLFVASLKEFSQYLQ
jgi:flagellar biosynthesis/type III secretory pathway protein FliH